MLDIYDRVGIAVMDENRNLGNTSEFEHQFRDLVARDGVVGAARRVGLVAEGRLRPQPRVREGKQQRTTVTMGGWPGRSERGGGERRRLHVSVGTHVGADEGAVQRLSPPQEGGE